MRRFLYELIPCLAVPFGLLALGPSPAQAQYGVSGAPYTQTSNLDNCASSSVSLNTMAINQFYLYSASGVSVLYAAGVNSPGTTIINMQTTPPPGATIVKAYLEVLEWASGIGDVSVTSPVSFGGGLTPAGFLAGQGNFENVWTDPRYGTDFISGGNNQFFNDVRYDVTGLVTASTSTYTTNAPGVLDSLVVVYTVNAPSACGAVALADGLFAWGGSHPLGSNVLDYGVTPWYSTLDWSCQHSASCSSNQFSRWGGVDYPDAPVTGFGDEFFGTNSPAPAQPPNSILGAGTIFQDASTNNDTFLDTYANVPLSDPSGKITWGLASPFGANKVYYWVNLLAASCASQCDTPTPTATPTNTPTGTLTATFTNSATPTPSSTPTLTATSTSTGTPTNTATQTPTATLSPTSTASPTPTSTPTMTDTATDSSTPTLTATSTPTGTPTNSATSTATPTLTPTFTATLTFTPSPTPTNTATVTPTSTPTFTATPTLTPTNTATSTLTDTSSPTSTPTLTATRTPTSSPTITDIPTDSFTPTFTFSPTDSATPTYSPTSSFTFTATATSTQTFTPTMTATLTPTSSPTATPTLTATPTITFTPTVTDTSTPTGTPTPTLPPQPYTVTLSIYNSAGELVKQLLVEKSSQPIVSLNLNGNTITSFTGSGSAVSIYYGGTLLSMWDGTDSSGNPVSNGAYFVKVDSIDSLGSDQSVVQTVTVDRPPARLEVELFNEAGEAVRVLYVNEAGAGPVTSVQLSSQLLQAGSPSQGQVTIGMSNGMTLTWDGTASDGSTVANGTYCLEVFSQNGTDGQVALTKNITVVNANRPGLGLYAYPNPWRAGDPPLTFQCSSAQTLTLKVLLYDMAGEKVGVLQGSPGTNQAAWANPEVANGVYLAVVELRDSSGNLAGRQTLEVLLEH